MGKKKSNLSKEEALARALVPESEWPYRVPGNWVWVRINYIAELHRGVTYKKSDAFEVKTSDLCLVLRGGNIEEGSINTIGNNVYISKKLVRENQLVKKNDVVLVSSTGSTKVIGRAGISNENYSDVAFGAFLTLVRPKVETNNKYICYFFQSNEYRNEIRSLAKGVNINNIKNEYIESMKLPLPPLAEQQRIVDRIESLFEKLDQAKGLIQEALDSFEYRKAAILHKAFSGELTKKWREENGLGMESWENRAFGELISESKLGLVKGKSEQSFIACYKYLKMNNITISGLLMLDEMISVDASEEEVEAYKLQNNDFLFNTRNSRELVGKNTVFNSDFDEPILYNNNIMRVRFKTGVEPSYISYYLNSPEGKADLDVIKKVTTNVAAIYSKDLNKIEIPLPSQNEQQEIVKVVSSVLQKDKCAFDLCSLMDTIDHMKKSILAHAFRGELGTNDPVEESSLVW
jgi:type I restriction enzyme S subunit